MTGAIDSYGRAAAAYGRAVNAYARAAGGDPAPGPEAAAGGGSSFADVLSRTVDQSIAAGAAAERQAMAAVGSGTDLTQLVTAVAEAETTLQTATAVRERLIEAYKEILRMTV